MNAGQPQEGNRPVMNDNQAADGHYAVDQIIEYPSFSSTGWSTGKVVRYASEDEQTRRCPSCDRLAVPQPVTGAVIDTLLRRCDRCEAAVIFGPLDPVMYILNHSDGKPFASPFRMRESQLRVPGLFTALITPAARRGGGYQPVDAPGPQEWDCTEFARQHPGYMKSLIPALDAAGVAVDVDDLFRRDPAAPAWTRAWDGPFIITIKRETAE